MSVGNRPKSFAGSLWLLSLNCGKNAMSSIRRRIARARVLGGASLPREIYPSFVLGVQVLRSLGDKGRRNSC